MDVRFARSFVIFLFAAATASAQYIQVNDQYTAQDLVEDVLINSGCAIISNVSVSGAAYANGNSYGYFSGNGSSFPFQDGIILSTGRAVMAEGPNTSLLDDGGNINWPGDTDLEQALGINNSINATVLEFDFVPVGNKISFQYMLSSEEYHDNAPCNYSDGFAFLLKPAGSTATYQNLAVIPGTNTPVKVTSVHPTITGPGGCPAQNAQYFDAFNGTEHPTNFNGQTKVLTALADVVPGTAYHIKLVIADEGNYRYDSAIFIGGGSFNMITDLGPDRLFATGNPLCAGQNYVLDATSAGAVSYQWYKDADLMAGQTGPTYTATESGVYTVDVVFSAACSGYGSITLEYAAPVALPQHTFFQCDEDGDGLTAYYLNRVAQEIVGTMQGYATLAIFETASNAAAGSNPLPMGINDVYYNTAPQQILYALVENEYGCQGIVEVVLDTPNHTAPQPGPVEVCDTDGVNDGFFTFNLSAVEAQLLQGTTQGTAVDFFETPANALAFKDALLLPYTNTVAGGQTIYAQLTNAAGCLDIVEVQLVVHAFGESLENETVYMCDGQPMVLDAGAGYTSYTWNTTPAVTTQMLTVSQPGTYTVTVTNIYNCTGSKTFTVLPSGRATGATVEISDFQGGGNNTATIIPQGHGDYEYSLNGITWQQSPTFSPLEAGEYTIYIRDINGCSPVLGKNFFVLDYPKFFTPNGDGTRDTWRIPYLERRPGVRVAIFDRYGKFIVAFRGSSIGWDGTFGSKNLPATDYWFVINLEDGREVKGHFALIR
jgi:gliding motility-associated-like protein